MAKILVVDDTRAGQEELERIVTAAGHEAIVVGDGRAAIRVAHTEPIDLVLLDLYLPGLDGLEVLRLLKQRAGETNAFVPVILTSVRGDAAARVEGLRFGADDFVSRPCDEAELMARIEGLLRIRAHVERIASGRSAIGRAVPEIDPLTGLPDRLGLQTLLQAELARARRYGRPLTVAALAIDACAAIAERWGGPVGEELLCAFARLLREGLRESDRIARIGSATFGLLLPETPLSGALAVVRRLQQKVAGTPFGEEAITASAGMASWPEAPGEELLPLAEKALAEAAERGGGRLCWNDGRTLCG